MLIKMFRSVCLLVRGAKDSMLVVEVSLNFTPSPPEKQNKTKQRGCGLVCVCVYGGVIELKGPKSKFSMHVKLPLL